MASLKFARWWMVFILAAWTWGLFIIRDMVRERGWDKVHGVTRTINKPEKGVWV